MAEFSAVCEADGPVRVLALEPGEVLKQTLQVGERTVHTIFHLEPPSADAPVAQTTPAALWSTGRCGESPVQLDPEARYPFTTPRWP